MKDDEKTAHQEAHETINRVLAECLELATASGVGITVMITVPIADSGSVRMGMDTNIAEDEDLVVLSHVAHVHGAICGEAMNRGGARAMSLSMHAFTDGLNKSAEMFDRETCAPSDGSNGGAT